MKLYRTNERHILVAGIHDLIAIGMLVEVEPTDRRGWCFTHDSQWWPDSCMDECGSSCDIGELVRVPKEDNG